ncbi:hypothetical protein [Solilutibacter silvestris]|uniref:hypothetical protein n=1 Tax=Solilutibacter silvestris TaxID=1645665 RepID=UPI003D34D2D3
MSVSAAIAYELLKTCGLLEFELKKRSSYLSAGHERRAEINWSAAYAAIRQLPPAVFFDKISAESRDKFLGGSRDRPMIQFIVSDGGIHQARYLPKPLPANASEALVNGMRRVRNNLFHGGKADPLEEASPGDDEAWANAALDVANCLLLLIRDNGL